MISYILIGGQNRPICFGNQVAYDYEIQTGKNYAALRMSVVEMIGHASAATFGDQAGDMEVADVLQHIGDVRKHVEHFSIVPFTDLVYYGMLYAHRREGIEIDFEAADVAGWVFDDQDAMNVCMQLFVDSLPQLRHNEAAKKKMMSQSMQPNASTGKHTSKQRR